MANLFWISAAQVVKDLGDGPHSAATLLAQYGWTFARADATTCRTYWDKNGLLQTAAANMLPIQYEDLNADGVREAPTFPVDGSRVNVVLWNRDLTNAAWVKTNITPVKDQTGIDGVASSASKITASAGNGTCLQAIVLGSSQRAQSCYVKRITGSGTINMTMDNGATWTAVTVTANWAKVTIPSQTLANPTVGFRIVTSGDAIAVDYVQNETGAFESMPIATTTAAVTRTADSWTFTGSIGAYDLTVWQRSVIPAWMALAGDIVLATFFTRIGSATPLLDCRSGSSSRIYVGTIDTPGTDSQQVVAIPVTTVLSSTFQFKNFASAPQVAIDPGSGLTAFASAASIVAALGNTTVRIGGSGIAGQELWGSLLDLKARAGLVTLASMATEPFAPINPFEVTDFEIPGPLISKAQSGRVNLRGTQQIGRTWTERYLLKVSDTTHKGFQALVNQYWRNGTIFPKGHVDYATPKGSGGGTPLVKGASQTGSALIVDGCPLNTSGWLRAGDIFRVQGLAHALQAATDVNTEGDGRAVIALVNPIFTGGSPVDNATLIITGVTLDVVILEPPSFPTTSATGADWGELVLKFSEAL